MIELTKREKVAVPACYSTASRLTRVQQTCQGTKALQLSAANSKFETQYPSVIDQRASVTIFAQLHMWRKAREAAECALGRVLLSAFIYRLKLGRTSRGGYGYGNRLMLQDVKILSAIRCWQYHRTHSTNMQIFCQTKSKVSARLE